MKKMNYIEVKTGDYITLNCKLKEEYKEVENYLYRYIYQAKLDGQFHKCGLLAEEHHTGEFVGTLKQIMSQEVIDTTELLKCSKRKDHTISPQVKKIMTGFFDMFDYSEESRMSSSEYTTYMYFAKTQGVFGKESVKEATYLTNAFQSNTELFTTMGYFPTVKESVEKVEEKRLEKVIVPFTPRSAKKSAIKA